MPTRPGSSNPRRGFTVIEILIVVTIIALLMTILIIKLRPALIVTKSQQTRVTMEALRTMVDELRQTTDLNGFYPAAWPDHYDATTISSIGADPNAWTASPPVVRTRILMAKLLAVPANKKILARLPSENFKVFPLAAGDPAGYTTIPIPVDGWGSPILYVPPNGIILTTDAGLRRVTAARIQAPGDAVPMGIQGFWMSAGEDNNYQTGKDNVYSFDNN
ncbi:MAG: type II secretion system protein [Tepidisphaerales bacterium]